MRAEPFFLPVATGRRFCLHHPPQGELRGTLLYAHPFAEEMNKSRRMAALGARAFAARGWAVLQIDLHGCGDSSGDFGDASLAAWRDDLLVGAQWLRARYGRVDALWGLRFGALLASSVMEVLGPVHLLLWQPVYSGAQHMAQFLRLRTAAEMLDPNAPKEGAKALREALRRGESLDIAGYSLPQQLAEPIETLKLQVQPSSCSNLWCFEIANDDSDALSPATAQFIEQARAAGVAAEAQRVRGPAFWQSVEIEEAPALIDASIAALEHWSGNARA